MLANRRGSRVGMYRQLTYPVLEIHNNDGEAVDYCV